ncbi:MAG: hypothetical protein FJY21_02990 [Bacteroidetes bacterium]|nr:hypothetical protein [Bacteroidota bacterium]
MPRRNDETMSTLKNNIQKRINAAAAPDAIKVNAKAWSVPTAPSALGGGKKVNGDFVLGLKLMNDSFSIDKNTAGFMSVKL